MASRSLQKKERSWSLTAFTNWAKFTARSLLRHKEFVPLCIPPLSKNIRQFSPNWGAFFCQHSMHIFIKKAVSDPMSLKWLLFVFIWQRGPLFNSKRLFHSELSRILTCVFQSMMPHFHTLLGRQSHNRVQADSQQGNDPYIHVVKVDGMVGF